MTVEEGNRIVPAHQPKEYIYSCCFTELALQTGTEMSYRNAVQFLNKLLHRDTTSSIKLRTYSDYCTKHGKAMEKCLQTQAAEILEKFGFNGESAVPKAEIAEDLKTESEQFQKETDIQEAIERINANRPAINEQVKKQSYLLEKPEESSYVFVDDIGVKHQKEHRTQDSKKQGAYVWNTVAFVQSATSSYTFSGVGMQKVFCFVLAYLLSHRLLEKKKLIFFTDGASDIRKHIETIFSFRNYEIILDWYHLKKRCQEYLSMSIKGGKEKRNEILQKLLRILWAGNVSEAIEFLSALDTKLLRPNHYIDKLCTYFEKHRKDIPAYALRHELGLRNSSNRVEKANDLVVAHRQKKNGMSWSTEGSGSLAAIQTMFLNHDYSTWLSSKTLSCFCVSAA